MIGIYQKLVEPLSPERLARLQRAEFIAKQYCNIFPTPESWKWFRRTRKSRLIAGGALIETTSGDLIDPALFASMLPELLVSSRAMASQEAAQ